ncbi:MAG: hypothetical protein AAF394_04620, partial [Planctomycetota bacterium]
SITKEMHQLLLELPEEELSQVVQEMEAVVLEMGRWTNKDARRLLYLSELWITFDACVSDTPEHIGNVSRLMSMPEMLFGAGRKSFVFQDLLGHFEMLYGLYQPPKRIAGSNRFDPMPARRWHWRYHNLMDWLRDPIL